MSFGTTFWLDAYLITIAFGLFIVSPYFAWVANKTWGLTDSVAFYYLVFGFISLIPIFNLFFIFAVVSDFFDRRSKKLFHEKHPEYKTVKKLEKITYYYAEADFDQTYLPAAERVGQLPQYVSVPNYLYRTFEQNYQKVEYTTLLARYDFAVSEVLSSLTKVQGLGNEAHVNVLKTAHGLFSDIYFEIEQMNDEENKRKIAVANEAVESLEQTLATERDIQKNHKLDPVYFISKFN